MLNKIQKTGFDEATCIGVVKQVKTLVDQGIPIVLHDVKLYAEPGQKIAFVGSTGAGKTTITNPVSYTHLDVYKRQPKYLPS